MSREASSYRDPDGFVFHDGTQPYRRVWRDDAVILNPAYQDFYKEAVAQKLLLPFKTLDRTHSLYSAYPGGGAILELPRLSVVTYPYEWGFAQLKAAALVTLDICLLALEHGLTLKDATAFNIQQQDGAMIFIDHTSFEPSDNKLPWRPYGQFCRHFLVPLLITSARGKNANKLFRQYLDGPDLEEACLSLPLSWRFKPAVFFHVFLHRQFTEKYKHSNDAKIKTQKTGNQTDYVSHLKRVIEGIKPPRYDTEWHDYYHNTNYKDAAFLEKERLLKECVAGKSYRCIWDVGGNNGHFSRVVADHAGRIVSMDIDHGAVDLNFLKNREQNITNIYPIVQDWTNPSPGLGLANAERKTMDERAKPDLIIALAVIHHLSITFNVPFDMLARQLADYNAELIIEFVDREDSQIKKLLMNKDDPYAYYNQADFEKSFSAVFDLISKREIAGTERCLYQFKPRQ